MFLDILFALFAFYLMIPFVAGYFAYSYGRSFWLWFCIASVLPVVSHFLLVFLIYWDEKNCPVHRLSRREEADMSKLIKKVFMEMENKRKAGQKKIKS